MIKFVTLALEFDPFKLWFYVFPAHNILIVGDKSSIFHICIHWGKTFLFGTEDFDGLKLILDLELLFWNVNSGTCNILLTV